MNWRGLLLTGALAASLSLSLVPRANADPPPWAGKGHHGDHEKWERGHEHWRHDRDRDHDHWRHDDGWRYRNRTDNDWWRDHNRNNDWRRWQDRPRYDGYRPYYGSNPRNDGRYGQLMQRMDNDRAKIAEIGPTGRHRKALQWYQDDMRNAQRDLQNYR